MSRYVYTKTRKAAAQSTAPVLNEPDVQKVLTETRGDLVSAASILNVPHWDLDRFIRKNKSLHDHLQAIGALKIADEYAHFSDEQFADEIRRLTLAFRLLALQELAKVAMISERSNAPKLQAKVKACALLYGGSEVSRESPEAQSVLEELNILYQAAAPRIKEIRQTVVKLMDDSEVNGRVIEQKVISGPSTDP